MERDPMAVKKLKKEVKRGLRLLRKRGNDSQKVFAARMFKIIELIEDFKPIDIGTMENGAWEVISREIIDTLDEIEAGSRIKNLGGVDDPIWVETLKKRLEDLTARGEDICSHLEERSRDYYLIKREIADMNRAISILEESSGEEVIDTLENYLKTGYIPVNDPEKEFNEVLEVNPLDYTALINLMALFDKDNRIYELIAIGDHIVSHYPEDLLSRVKFIEGLIKDSEYDKALEIAEEGIKLAVDYNGDERQPWNRFVSQDSFDNLRWRVNEIKELESGKFDPDSEACAVVEGGEIEEIVELGEDAVLYLRTAILRGDPISESAPEILSKIEGDLAKKAMVDGLKLFDDKIVGAFAERIIESGEEMVPHLKAEIMNAGSENARNRFAAINCLTEMKGVEAAYNTLLELLSSENMEIAGAAGLGLGYFGDRRAIESLREARARMEDRYKLGIDFAIKMLEGEFADM
ncbi:MAG: HEAT repeat domain-containing protein [Candidatus Syntropharchaeales archaeon]